MEREGAVRGLLLGLAVLWLQACATGSVATGGMLPVEGLLPDGTQGAVLLGESRRREPELSEARRAEVECALAQVWGVARGVEEEGARVELRFWAQGGALTLLSHHTRGGQGRAEPVDEGGFEKGLRRLLTDYVGERTGEVVFTLRRERRRWEVDFRGDSDVPRPREAKTQPVRREGVSVGTYAGVTQVAGEMVRLMGGPAGSGAAFSATVELEDDGVSGWEPGPYEGAGREANRGTRERLQGELIQALLPFTHGVGRREVRLTLQGVHRPGEPSASWRVVVAETLQPPVSHGEDENLVAEYRALHETILREWREEVVESGRLMLRMGAEELAWWVIGGVVAHGGDAVLKEVAPRLVETLLRRGARAHGWLRSLLLRIDEVERKAFSRLWNKLDGRGVQSLTQDERRRLNGLARRLDALIDVPLDDKAKGRLRSAARRDYFKRHPEREALLVDEDGVQYPIHHRRPLELAQFFPEFDINDRANLAAVSNDVHTKINAVWTKFRLAQGHASAADVDKVVKIIDRYFGEWYDVVYQPRLSASALDQAEAAALEEVEKLVTRLMRRSK